MGDYFDANRAMWDERAPAHATSPDYAVERFVADPTFISDVVRFDLPRLGDVSGLRGVHLQCHIGTDTISLARLGARMTGLDFSGAAVEQARSLAERTGTDADFVQSDVYSAAEVLGAEAFDLVFTGVGALCWLPDIRRWAGVVSALLHPGARLFLREGHPMLWSLEDTPDDGRLVVRYPYFERPEPDATVEEGTYVETDATFSANLSYFWNHGLGEIVSALLEEGLELTMLEEHDSVPWNAVTGLMEQVGGGEWRLAEQPWRLAHSYTLQAVKR
ncbi:MAG: class I SAM-dependent methyltransferase [Actinomycetes bacterium]